MRKIFLIAGHNGAGTGASGYLDEGAETIVFRDLLDAELCKLGVIPETDFDRENEKLSTIVNWLKGQVEADDLCIDIHFNAASESAHGTEVLVPETPTTFEKKTAEQICSLICNVLGTKSRGVKSEKQSARGKLAMLSGFKCQQILIEICFCSNRNDVQKYESKKNELAKELANKISKLV